jgi:hypothetical protein
MSRTGTGFAQKARDDRRAFHSSRFYGGHHGAASARVAEGGTLTLATGITSGGPGIVQIDSGAALVVDSSVIHNQMAFGGPASLILADAKAFKGTIGSFGSGDVIDVEKLAANTLTYAGGTLTLEHGSTVLDTLTFSGSYIASDFGLKADGHGGTDIVFAGAATVHDPAGSIWDGHDAGALGLRWMLMPHIA